MRKLDEAVSARRIDSAWKAREDWAAKPIPSARLQVVPPRRGPARETRLATRLLRLAGALLVATGVWFVLTLLTLWGW